MHPCGGCDVGSIPAGSTTVGYPRGCIAGTSVRRDDRDMRRISTRGTSVLAALVFVAIFVLFISSAKLIAPVMSSDAQSAAVAAAGTQYGCKAGEVHTVDLSGGWEAEISVRSEAHKGNACIVEFCPPSQLVTTAGTCFVASECDAKSGESSCLQAALQNASQPTQASSIIAAALLSEQGETAAYVPGSADPVFLVTTLSEVGQSGVKTEIDATATAAFEVHGDSAAVDEIKRIGTMAQVGSAPCDVAGGECAPDTRVSAPAAVASSRTTAQISCQPKIADTGMTIGIAFGCTNSVRSEGSGFSTDGTQWGATSTLIPAHLTTGTMTYTLSCIGAKEVATASCEVQVVKPVLLLTAEPMQAAAGESATIAWVSKGTNDCMLTSPEQPELSQKYKGSIGASGVVTTLPISEDTRVTLSCTTDGGSTKEVTTTVRSSAAED